MKCTRRTAEQIICKLKSPEQLIAQGKTVADASRVNVSLPPRVKHRRQQNEGNIADEAKRLTQLEKENARLKKL